MEKALVQMGILGPTSHENPSHIFLQVSPLKRLPSAPALYKQSGETPRSREIYFGPKFGVDTEQSHQKECKSEMKAPLNPDNEV